MGWTFKLHAGVATGVAAVLLPAAGLTWLPGLQPWAGSTPLLAVTAVAAFALFLAAFGRMVLAGADRRLLGPALRCLPVGVLAGLGALLVAGVLMLAVSLSGQPSLEDPRARDGHYYAFDTAPVVRAEVEIPRGRYQDVLEADTRAMEIVPAMLLVVSALVVLVAGELRGTGRR
ncbi:hypothetical protein ACIA8O_13540 [Kitasatospora sp. NPDC051853]|uniref:hypothetical protein n=1 Tax=Kitasatospora sp. NPDC051853 TaxID=3364058 RepID=UPI0037A33530